MPAQTTLVRCFMHWFLATGLLCGGFLPGRAETCGVTTGNASWNLSTSWNPQSIPNAIGASATFNGAATANNSAQTANRTLSLDVTQTIGSIVFNNDLSTFTTTISAGTGGTLTFNEAGAGP